jgi:hypothetical protein
MARSRRSFLELQRDHFREAAVEQYRWTTAAPGIAESEDELLEPVAASLVSPALEIGCGEGNNLARLLPRAADLGIVGIDHAEYADRKECLEVIASSIPGQPIPVNAGEIHLVGLTGVRLGLLPGDSLVRAAYERMFVRLPLGGSRSAAMRKEGPRLVLSGPRKSHCRVEWVTP